MRDVVEERDGEFVLPLEGMRAEALSTTGGSLCVTVEAWELRGPGDVNVVCLPGGGEPAIWDATTPTYTMRPGETHTEFMQRVGHWFEHEEEEDK